MLGRNGKEDKKGGAVQVDSRRILLTRKWCIFIRRLKDIRWHNLALPADRSREGALGGAGVLSYFVICCALFW